MNVTRRQYLAALGTSTVTLLGGCSFDLSSQYFTVVIENETTERKTVSMYILDDNGGLSYGVKNASMRGATEGSTDRITLGEVPVSEVHEVVVTVGDERMPPYLVEDDDCPDILLIANIESSEEVSFNQSCGDQLSV